MERKDERRSYPRIQDDNVSLKLKIGQFDIMTHTLNISASGVYCKIDREIPLMSRVKLALMIPAQGSPEKEETKTLEMTGVVVREHPVIIDGRIMHYDVAIFFEDYSARRKEIISQYICQKIDPRAAL